MLNFGWAELMVIGVVALIVIGPDDLPDMFRQLGRFTAKLRSMSREFSRAMEQAAKDTGVKDVAKDLKGMTSPKALGLDAVKSAADKFEKWDPIKNAAKPSSPMTTSLSNAAKPLMPAPMPATPLPTVTMVDPAVAGLDDLGEADDDLADCNDAEAATLATPAHGPATQALYDKQAARAEVLAEQSAKLKAIEAGTYVPSNSILTPPLPIAEASTLTEAKKRVAKPKITNTESTLKQTKTDAAVTKTPRKTSKKADTV